MARSARRFVGAVAGFVSIAIAPVVMAWTERGPGAPPAEAAAPAAPRDVAAAEPGRDRGKRAIESPLKDVIAQRTVAGAAQPIDPPTQPPAGESERASEAVSEAADQGAAAPARLRTVDVRKHVIENPVKTLIAGGAAHESSGNTAVPAVEAPPPAARPSPTAHAGAVVPAPTENPAVPPGLVRWYADFNQARAAADQSGKPVLLFQMIGRLDQRFT